MKNRIETFFEEVSRCSLCHQGCGIHVPQPDHLPTSERASILIIGEQPDREVGFGTSRNGIRNPGPEMERLRNYLSKSGIEAKDVLYATCVLCLPRDPQKRQARPSLDEAKNCTRHVTKLIELAKPRVIIPLGHTAVQAMQWVYRDWKELRQFILNYDVGNVIERNGTAVYPLYHTSCSTVKARSEDRQSRDWGRLQGILENQERRETTTG